MGIYFVAVKKAMYCLGKVKVKANSPDEAVESIENEITKGSLQTTEVEWDDPQYEDCSFETTGDVEHE